MAVQPSKTLGVRTKDMILVVEDDAPSGRAIALALKTAGHEVMNAGDGTEALELLSMHDFELVITDLLMPNLSGQNLINTIRLKWPHMPVILTSGYLSKDLGVQFFFNETKSKDEVSRFWLWDSHRENPVGDVEKRLPYLPQDRRSRSDPYLGIPPR